MNFRNRGFTFTVSVLIISITLISMAAFSQEWRRSQQASFTELLPSEASRVQEGVSADFAQMSSASASVRRPSASTASVEISASLPFKKEGAQLADAAEYSASLPMVLRGKDFEAVVSAAGFSGSNATVMRFFDSGELAENNSGPHDVLTYYHPIGDAPANITLAIFSNKEYVSAGELLIVNASGSGDGCNYTITYSEGSGRGFSRTASAAKTSNASLTISYLDGTQLRIESNFSPSLARNFTRIYYTKSPGALLVLPLDQNATTDYSQFAVSMSLGGGVAGQSPQWVSDCRAGGCFSFDGSNDFISASNLPLAESAVEFAQGPERLANGGFEATSGSYWANWSVENVDDLIYDSSTAHSGSHAALMYPGSEADNFIYQQAGNLLENTQYTFSFWSSGAAARYRIIDSTTGLYLQAGGGWGSAYTFTGSSSAGFAKTARAFSLPLGSSSATAYLMPPSSGTVYYDDASLRSSPGMNGGFEYYYKDIGPGGSGFVPEPG